MTSNKLSKPDDVAGNIESISRINKKNSEVDK